MQPSKQINLQKSTLPLPHEVLTEQAQGITQEDTEKISNFQKAELTEKFT